jgi:hypothetical protein
MDTVSDLPWFLPAMAVSLVVSLAAAGRVGRALGIRRALAFVLLMAFGIIVAATLTQPGKAIHFGFAGSGTCDLTRLGPAPLGQLLAVNEASLNVLLFVPLGVVIGLLPRSRRKAVLLGAAVALPFVVEGIQLVVTALDRACESADVADNLTGLVLGLALGSLASWVGAHRARATGS